MKTLIQINSTASFSTPRLVARKIQEDDLEKLHTMHSDSQVMATLGGLCSIEKTRENLAWNLKQWEENDFGLWMFYLKETGEWVGRGGLRQVDIDGKHEIEVGYALMPSFWNQGLATEIAMACVEMAFEIFRLHDIVCFTLTNNNASQRVMEKAGFQYEREIVINYDGIDYPHALYRMKTHRKVEVVPYNPRWAHLFAEEAQRIQSVLGSHVNKIHHIGSTAIPGIPAKPIIDMMLECENLDDIRLITEKLNLLGYYYVRRQIIPHRSFFTRRQEEHIGFHLHILEQGDPQIKRHVNFKNYLIQHPEAVEDYAALKIQLAKQFADNINQYVIGKDKLVQAIDRKAKVWSGRETYFLSPNKGQPANQWSQEKLIKAMEANMNVHMTHFAQYIDEIELVRVPGYTLVNSGLQDDTFNYVLDADFSKNDADKRISEVIKHFSKKNIPFSWWVSPYDKPIDLSEHLEKAGLMNAENNIGMYFDLNTWEMPRQETQLEILRVKDAQGLQDFSNVLVGNFVAWEKYYAWIANILTEDDPIELYVGYINGKPVTRGQLVYFAQVAGIYFVSTAVDERRKGYATIIEQFLLQQAKRAGYSIAVLQASPEGLPLYLHQGFKQCGIFKEFKLR